MIENIPELFQDLTERVSHLRGFLDIDGKKDAIRKLDAAIAREDFWNDPETAKSVLKEKRDYEQAIESWNSRHRSLEDLKVLYDLAREEEDEETRQEVEQGIYDLKRSIRDEELKSMLSGEDDRKNAILMIHAGAGGTEAQDWADMILRMYLRWAERKGFRASIIDQQFGEEAGIKSATLTLEGEYAFGFAKAEVGIHRLVRISPFDAGARRHTSFASVFVWPEVTDEIVVEINEKDLRIDTYRSTGAGGQHVNKTDSAVRITHIPTGIVVQCQNERSQHKNRAVAMKVLRSRLYERKLLEQNEKLDEMNKSKQAIAFGSQIRSYVLHPYRLVKDHRTNMEIGNVNRVLDGDIDDLIEGYLLRH
ncbi:MAG TPA: peptide chain release factor 2 [Syntrophales bacterium]|nr:peptide chain release factor 2 [Syntrophales bacterium]HPX11390.1 peptide chain release factor 2 [Syntrophales bacterium]HQB29362.1 peptide chain release factor 2 [Syntrophales bacterium]HQN78695.1 peptide chain release factor 2 [Syntrophales bacterium]HQQ26793.1 peptide chain release factor 2 [Syntrophales bacterium]